MLTDDSISKMLESPHLSPLGFVLLHQQCWADTAASNNQKEGKSNLRFPL